MRKVAVEDAIGQALGHDITKIVPGKEKLRAFQRGHVVEAEDVEKLKDLGKEHIYIWEPNDTQVHEDDAAVRLANNATGRGIHCTKPSQGRVNLLASEDGLLKVQVDRLNQINNLDSLVFATLHNNRVVKKDQMLGGTRIVPLAIDAVILQQAEYLCREPDPLMKVLPFKPLWVAVVTTGSEVNSGRIKDGFARIMRQKINRFGGRWMGQVIVPDEPDLISQEIQNFVAEGAGLILVTGGMSVDADDATPHGIRRAASNVVFYGAPVLPGSQFMLAYQGHVAICGVPGGALFSRKTTLDLILPRIFAGDMISRADIVALGHGGLCEECQQCRFPNCAFGKSGQI